jgi:MscS family membrane protein
MNFLDDIYFDNTVRSYLAVLITILAVLAFRRLLSKYIAALLYSFVKKTWSTIEKNKFISLTVSPLGWFVAVTVSVFTIDKLNYPEILNFNIYHHSFNDILQKIGMIFIFVSFIRLLVRLIDFIASILHEKASINDNKTDDQLIIFFRDFLKVLINIVGLFLLIKVVFNQNISTLLTGLSIVGAALALAAKESLENLIASFIIFFDKPFFTGDSLKVNNISGTVERIGLRSTRIRTADQTLVTVPNKQMVDSAVDNMSMRTRWRAEVKLEMSEKTAVEDIEKFTKAVTNLLEAKKDKVSSFTIYVNDYSKSAITATLEYFTDKISYSEFNLIKEEVNIGLIQLRNELGIAFPNIVPSVNIIKSDTAPAAPKSNDLI